MVDNIQKNIQSVRLRAESNVNIIIKDYFPENKLVGGKYHVGSHTVTVFIEEIRKQCLQIFQSEEPLQDFITIVTAHEIGHAEDVELLDLIDQLDTATSEKEKVLIKLKIEENAWDFAATIIPRRLEGMLTVIRGISLQLYYDQLEERVS
ncbi:hypothetical protein Q73_14380 [Bacillus coahuilensis m2-6]|uniref:IrrE N-terminal-like domain-containing protein n=1 Tax=Bacillus coahuilensis p1.1.43 TaxID=1150625 RepID=A0A147K3Y7_9BACI|nr:hypothetical protein [Bacillus coahuilensis]KUP04008.1 hypothetical protein Q75_16975 [Bacillus coahuilensis p1.1.43]KUP05018.1 hypothetical protein Q73_14380 [Bacillus coahuilensis m2-6]